jgi:thiol-disulfide isomerase/thioredoxin
MIMISRIALFVAALACLPVSSVDAAETPLLIARSPAAAQPRRAPARTVPSAARDTTAPDSPATAAASQVGDAAARSDTAASAAPSTTAETPAATAPAAPPPPPAVQLVNAANPGERLSADSFIVPGKTTITDFYSVFCGPCMRIAPILEELAKRRSDIVVRKVDINRRGVRGIDWGSPLARQYGLQSIPHFKIYGADGNLLAEGDPAFEMILKWLRETGLME